MHVTNIEMSPEIEVTSSMITYYLSTFKIIVASRNCFAKSINGFSNTNWLLTLL